MLTDESRLYLLIISLKESYIFWKQTKFNLCINVIFKNEQSMMLSWIQMYYVLLFRPLIYSISKSATKDSGFAGFE